MSWFTGVRRESGRRRSVITTSRPLKLVEEHPSLPIVTKNDQGPASAIRRDSVIADDSFASDDTSIPKCDLSCYDDVCVLEEAVLLILRKGDLDAYEKRQLQVDFKHALYHMSMLTVSVRDRSTALNSLLQSINNETLPLTQDRTRRFVMEVTALLEV